MYCWWYKWLLRLFKGLARCAPLVMSAEELGELHNPDGAPSAASMWPCMLARVCAGEDTHHTFFIMTFVPLARPLTHPTTHPVCPTHMPPATCPPPPPPPARPSGHPLRSGQGACARPQARRHPHPNARQDQPPQDALVSSSPPQPAFSAPVSHPPAALTISGARSGAGCLTQRLQYSYYCCGQQAASK